MSKYVQTSVGGITAKIDFDDLHEVVMYLRLVSAHKRAKERVRANLDDMARRAFSEPSTPNLPSLLSPIGKNNKTKGHYEEA